jgi:hypothetical protein
MNQKQLIELGFKRAICQYNNGGKLFRKKKAAISAIKPQVTGVVV